MSIFGALGPGPGAPGRVWFRRRLLPLLLLILLPGKAPGQEPEPLNIPALESEYLAAQGEYQAAFFALEALESRYNQALEAFDEARASGDMDRTNRVFTTVQQLGAEVGSQERRVQQKARELEDARARLLEALGQRLEELIQLRDTTLDEEEQLQLAVILEDANNRLLELRAEEPPETTLEPMQDVTISPGDTPRDIRRKAATLDFRADQHEARLVEVVRRLERLEEDLRRARTVSDFVAGLERYDDTRLPVVSPGNRGVEPETNQRPSGADTLGLQERPLTLEERIQRLELLVEDLTRRMVEIRAKARRFTDIAGGGGRG